MYIQGFLLAVPEANRDAYIAMAERAAGVFKRHGVLEIMEAWEEDVADGKVTDFRMATKAQEGEKIVFSWMVWPDKATADACHAAMSTEPEMQEAFGEMPFDGMRMMWGGFTPVYTLGR